MEIKQSRDLGDKEDIFMCAGKFENKHGVGILVNKKWRKRINWTDYIHERAIATSNLVNKQRVLLMSEYFVPSLGVCGPSR